MPDSGKLMAIEKSIDHTIEKLRLSRDYIFAVSCMLDVFTNPVKRVEHRARAAAAGGDLADALLVLEQPLLAEFPEKFDRRSDIFDDARALLNSLNRGGVDGETELYARSVNLANKVTSIIEPSGA